MEVRRVLAKHGYRYAGAGMSGYGSVVSWNDWAAMRLLKTMVKTGSFVVCVAAVGWTLLVLASASVLGNAVLIAEADAYVALALNILALPSLLVLLMSLWRNRRHRNSQGTFVPVGYPMYAPPTYGAPMGYAPPPNWTSPIQTTNRPAA